MDLLCHFVIAAREESLIGVVAVGSLVVGRHLAVVVLGVLHEVVVVDPVVEHQHVVGGQQDSVASLQLTAGDLRANVLQEKHTNTENERERSDYINTVGDWLMRRMLHAMQCQVVTAAHTNCPARHTPNKVNVLSTCML